MYIQIHHVRLRRVKDETQLLLRFSNRRCGRVSIAGLDMPAWL
jgi:hypothetical protein